MVPCTNSEILRVTRTRTPRKAFRPDYPSFRPETTTQPFSELTYVRVNLLTTSHTRTGLTHLFQSAFSRVRGVAQVPPDLDAPVTADSAARR